jgi:hypothetical protein
MSRNGVPKRRLLEFAIAFWDHQLAVIIFRACCDGIKKWTSVIDEDSTVGIPIKGQSL